MEGLCRLVLTQEWRMYLLQPTSPTDIDRRHDAAADLCAAFRRILDPWIDGKRQLSAYGLAQKVVWPELTKRLQKVAGQQSRKLKTKRQRKKR